MKGADLILKGHPSGEDKARLRIFQLFEQLLLNTPKPIRTTRTVLCANLMFTSLATYAQIMLSEGSEQFGNKELFISNLVDNLYAIVNTPPSAQTLELLPEH